MTEKQQILFQHYLESLDLNEEEQELLNNIALTFSSHPEVFRQCQLLLINSDKEYHYNPIIGAPLEFEKSEDSKRVSLKRLSSKMELSLAEFTSFLSKTDLILSKIYPLGTIVELDATMLPKELVSAFETANVSIYVLITGRRIMLDKKNAYMDYEGTLWPYGNAVKVDPIYFQHVFIKDVIAEGYTNQIDDNYCDKSLREEYLHQGTVSTLYLGGQLNED